MKEKKGFIAHCALAIAALFINTLGLCILRLSCLGSEPLTGFCYSLNERFGWSVTLCMGVLNAVLLLADLIFYRKALGFGTLTGLFIVGFFSDFWRWLLMDALGFRADFVGSEQIVARLLLLLVGLGIAVISCAFYLAAQIGMAPYDSVGYLVEAYTKIPFKWVRVVQDSLIVFLTYIVASVQGTQWQIIGVGTIVMAVGLGPVLTILQEKIALPFYRKVDEMIEKNQKVRRCSTK